MTKEITEIQVTELPNLEHVTIYEVGEENVYFLFADGSPGFFKLSNWEAPHGNEI